MIESNEESNLRETRRFGRMKTSCFYLETKTEYTKVDFEVKFSSGHE